MNQDHLYQVLLAPRMTEKTVMVSESSNQYVFKVATTATKKDIKQAVETLFEVKVDRVQTANMKGKQKNFSRRSGKRSDWKKAYIRLAEGQSLDASAE
uniref:Large ribosomal subunit protein uL23 n=1 Tax=uncultured Thiotrichaceae bacterium TaxID=298394 RepID=A0A6S6U8N2_9GAMM|nr:MAG: LSU ribosomal protein L23p (L23Ae) [uncultured Thiotrichaceae bacterium]